MKSARANTSTLQTDNPGPWFLHCHIDFHLEAGFAVVMAEDIPDTAAQNPVPRKCIAVRSVSTIADALAAEAWSDLCPIYDALSEEDL